jgi:hypothetical protein
VLLDSRVSVGATFADYDNDGNEDLFVTTTRAGNVLFHNRGDGTFEDVTAKAGLAHNGHSQTAVFFDYDNDGLLDLFLTNTARWTTENFDAGHNYDGKASLEALMSSATESNILYHNNGNGTFTDVTDKARMRGEAGSATSPSSTMTRTDSGRVRAEHVRRGQLYHNNQDGTFTDVTATTLGATRTAPSERRCSTTTATAGSTCSSSTCTPTWDGAGLAALVGEGGDRDSASEIPITVGAVGR